MSGTPSRVGVNQWLLLGAIVQASGTRISVDALMSHFYRHGVVSAPRQILASAIRTGLVSVSVEGRYVQITDLGENALRGRSRVHNRPFLRLDDDLIAERVA